MSMLKHWDLLNVHRERWGMMSNSWGSYSHRARTTLIANKTDVEEVVQLLSIYLSST